METYTVEVVRWSRHLQCEVPYRLTFMQTWMPDRQLWRDFLVRSEEIEDLHRLEFQCLQETQAA
jgi:hypothetical protein